MRSEIFGKHGGFRKLGSFQTAQIIYDGTVIFCERFIDKKSKTHYQMVQAARSSGIQNIAQGSLASATSKKTELKIRSDMSAMTPVNTSPHINLYFTGFAFFRY